jgi:hypothetical protein
MKKSRSAPAAPPGDWQKWTTELPATTVVLLKVRAAQEHRPMREVLRDAVEAYVKTAVPR